MAKKIRKWLQGWRVKIRPFIPDQPKNKGPDVKEVDARVGKVGLRITFSKRF